MYNYYIYISTYIDLYKNKVFLFIKTNWVIICYICEKLYKMNRVFIATSLDGYIADKNGGIDWLNQTPNPDHIDMGYADFINKVDAIVMGRNTFEIVCSFDIDWPYTVPVFVLSNSLKAIPAQYQNKAQIIKGAPKQITQDLNLKGYKKLYIDGGKTIQSFLQEDLIDEMTITTIPILLGGGYLLFGELNNAMEFEHVKTNVFLNAIVQNTYKRKR